MRKRKRINCVLLLVMLAFAVTFGITARQVFERQSEYSEARDEYDELRELVGVMIIPHPYVPENIQTNDYGADESAPEYEQQEGIDFNALFAINPRTIGWLYLPGSRISYPIAQGDDNHHYLRHTFSGRRNNSGAIFLDYRDEPDFVSRAKIYGHNMNDGSMFGTLRSWNGDRFYIHTPDGVIVFTVTWRGSLPLTEVVQLDGVALITCVNGNPNVRYVVRAERIY